MTNKSLIHITGYGNLDVIFNTRSGSLNIALFNVGVILCLGFDQFSLKVVNNEGHDFAGRARGEILILNDHLVFPLRGNMYQAGECRMKHSI